MKRFLLLLVAAASLCACATHTVAPTFHAPSVAPVKAAIDNSAAHIKSAQGATKRIADACKQKSATWAAAYDDLQKELDGAYAAAKLATEQADALQKQNDQLANDANTALTNITKERDAAQAAEKIAVAKYHRAKFYGSLLCGLIIFAAMMLLRSIVFLIPVPWNIVALIGVPALGTLLFNLLL